MQIYENSWDIAKVVLIEIFIAENMYIKKEKRSQISKLVFYLSHRKKKSKLKPKQGKGKK